MTNPKHFLRICHQLLALSRDHLDLQSEDLWETAVCLARSFSKNPETHTWSESFGRVKVLVSEKDRLARIITYNEDLVPAKARSLAASLVRATEWCEAFNKVMTGIDLRSESIAFCKATVQLSVAEIMTWEIGDHCLIRAISEALHFQMGAMVVRRSNSSSLTSADVAVVYDSILHHPSLCDLTCPRLDFLLRVFRSDMEDEGIVLCHGTFHFTPQRFAQVRAQFRGDPPPRRGLDH